MILTHFLVHKTIQIKVKNGILGSMRSMFPRRKTVGKHSILLQIYQNKSISTLSFLSYNRSHTLLLPDFN